MAPTRHISPGLPRPKTAPPAHCTNSNGAIQLSETELRQLVLMGILFAVVYVIPCIIIWFRTKREDDIAAKSSAAVRMRNLGRNARFCDEGMCEWRSRGTRGG